MSFLVASLLGLMATPTGVDHGWISQPQFEKARVALIVVDGRFRSIWVR
ncbi:MAG: hypothetical protein GY708_13465 [Actinomycetia bacterium]|nr:hypothetical protein [Actinomycetes bacterium]MCP4963110.1 hypothetical protein [Actinomycetes bacterium]